MSGLSPSSVLRSLPLALGALGGVMLTGCLLAPVTEQSEPQSVQWIDSENQSHDVKLPHRLEGAARRAGGEVAYTVRWSALHAEQSGHIGVVALADMNVNEVRLGGRDGAPLLDVAHTQYAWPNHWNRPLLFVADAADFDLGGTNAPTSMTLVVEAEPGGHGGLRFVAAGPLVHMQRLHRRLTSWLVTAAEISTAAVLLFALLMLAVWLGARQNRLYIDFALVCALFALSNLNHHVFEPPIPYGVWIMVMSAALDAFIVMLHLFTRRLVGCANRRVTRAGMVFVVVAAAVPALVPAEYHVDAQDAFHALSLLWGLASLVLLFRARNTLSPVSRAAFLAVGGALLAIGVHDILQLNDFIVGAGVPLVQFAAVMLVVTCFVALIGDLVRVLQLEKTMVHRLEARVAENVTALKHTHDALVEVEKARAMSEERERMSRELHDGTAGQLVTLLAMLETDSGPDEVDLSAYVRHVIDDLRLTMQSMDPTMESLGELLGTLRPFLETQVQAAGAQLAWRVGDTPEATVASDVLHGIGRIVQEAVTNAARHAGASEVSIHAEPTPDGGAQIVVADDGRGLDEEAPLGRGRRNMHVRATAMKATLEIRGEGGEGTTVTLSLPPTVFPRSAVRD